MDFYLKRKYCVDFYKNLYKFPIFNYVWSPNSLWLSYSSSLAIIEIKINVYVCKRVLISNEYIDCGRKRQFHYSSETTSRESSESAGPYQFDSNPLNKFMCNYISLTTSVSHLKFRNESFIIRARTSQLVKVFDLIAACEASRERFKYD